MKSVHNPCPYGNDDCPKCNMTPTTPSREDWRDDFRDFFFEEGKYENRIRGVDAYIAFISDLLQNHNNALVAEIEKEKRDLSECGGCYLFEGCGCRVDSFNKALDTIIRIIQEK